MVKRQPGVKVPLGKHELLVADGSVMDYRVVCSCGWGRTSRYPRYVNPPEAKHDATLAFAAHVRHMTLVHDQQTHGDEGCGQVCIYPRRKPEGSTSESESR